MSFKNVDPNELKQWVPQKEMYTSLLNISKGPDNLENGIDWNGQLAPEDINTMRAGMVCHIDPETNQFKQGLVPNAVPFLARPKGDYVGGNPEGNVYGDGMTAIPCTASYIVQSTEYDPELSYPPNTPLTSPATGEDKGVLLPGEYGEDTIAGIVLRGPHNVIDSRSVIEFATWFMPCWLGGSL